MSDPRGDFVARVDLSKTRVRAFEGFIFLCGGPKGNDPLPARSLRHMIYHELTNGRHGDVVGRLKLAEEIQDWFEDGNYRDLVTFEEHLAGLSAVIVLVVESAGAIAELGAFTVSPAIVDRLLVVVAELHYEAHSFIRLGPLRRLENSFDKAVLVYDWHTRSITGTSSEDFEKIRGDLGVIVEEIKKFTRPHHAERIFKKEEPAHVMLLVCELCDLFSALQITEIREYLRLLGIEIEEEELKKYLFLLEKCDLLGKKAKGHGRYYYAIDWVSRISFAFLPGAHIDKERVRVEVAEYYQQHIKTRFDVISNLRKAS